MHSQIFVTCPGTLIPMARNRRLTHFNTEFPSIHSEQLSNFHKDTVPDQKRVEKADGENLIFSVTLFLTHSQIFSEKVGFLRGIGELWK
jgi:hypothetical protein